MAEAYRCEQLAQGSYAAFPRVGFEVELNPRSDDRKSNALYPLRHRSTEVRDPTTGNFTQFQTEIA